MSTFKPTAAQSRAIQGEIIGEGKMIGGKVSEGIVQVRYGIAAKSHENEFFRFFARAIKAYFEKKGIEALLIGMPFCRVYEDLQIDALLVTDSQMVIIDFKDYSGEVVLPDERDFRRGRWETTDGIQVKGGSSPNPFCQTGLQRERLAKILETTCRNLSKFNPRHISTMVCFQGDMAVVGTIPGYFRPCFFIADRSNFLEKLYDIVTVGNERAGLLDRKFLDFLHAKLFESDEYDLTVTPESLGIIPETTHTIEEPKVDGTIAEKVAKFFESDAPILMVTGTVGSGKAALSSTLRDAALDAGYSSARVFALSNRVKRNLLDSIDDVESLYSALYDFSSTKVFEDGSRYIPLGKLEELRAFDDLEGSSAGDGSEGNRTPSTEASRTVFIVYESQMITDSLRTSEELQFGSGRLLSDLLEHLGIKPGIHSENKVVFVGDKFQLGFGSWSDSCLNPEFYKDRFSTASIELPDTECPTGIQQVCLDIANVMRTGCLSQLVLISNDQLSICDSSEEAGLLREAEKSWKTHKVISYTNSQACGLNSWVKRNIKHNGTYCAVGDIVLFENEVLAYPSSADDYSESGSVFQFGSQEPTRIPNGAFGTIVRLGGEASIKVDINGAAAPVSLTLVEADVRICVDDTDETLEIQFIKEFLESGENKLDTMESLALKIYLEKLFKDALAREPFEKGKFFEEMLAHPEDYVEVKEGVYRDPNDRRRLTRYETMHRQEVQKGLKRGSDYYRWSNAALIKYGWCMTVHKAMSYRWDTVTFTTRFDKGRDNEEYYRLLYTGISRAERHVNLVRWKPISPFGKAEFGASGQGAPAAKNGVLFRTSGDDVVPGILEAVRGLEAQGFTLLSSKPAQYQLICEVEKGSVSAKVIFYYNKKGEVTRLALATGDGGLLVELREALMANEAVHEHVPSGTPMKWLYDYLNENVLTDSVLEIEESSNYLDVLKAHGEDEGAQIRVNYRKNQTVSNFKLMLGSEHLYEIIVSDIKTHYQLD